MRLLFRYDYTIYGEDMTEFFIGFQDELNGEDVFVQTVVLTVVFQDYSTLFQDYHVSAFSDDPSLELEERIHLDLQDRLSPNGTACVTIAVWGQ